MQITFWCPNQECRLSNTMTVKFNKDQSCTVKKIQETSVLIEQQNTMGEVEITARPKANR